MRTALTFALVLLSTSTAHAVSYTVEAQTYMLGIGEEKLLMPEAEIFLTHDLTDTFGIFAFSLVNSGPTDGFEGRWAQTQFGPTVYLNDGMQFGLGPALEQADVSARAATWLYMDQDHWPCNAFLVFEHGFDGSDDYWYQGVVNYNVGVMLFGIMAERTFGIGPRLDLPIESSAFRAHATWAKDFESDSTNALFGIAWDGPN